MSAPSIPTLASGRYFPRVAATERDAKPRIENGAFVPGFCDIAPDAKARVIADLPLIKLVHRFATDCPHPCCA